MVCRESAEVVGFGPLLLGLASAGCCAFLPRPEPPLFLSAEHPTVRLLDNQLPEGNLLPEAVLLKSKEEPIGFDAGSIARLGCENCISAYQSVSKDAGAHNDVVLMHPG
mmetsp:Transcript_8952/g.22619  ORF Transcript_8952/g.22619 Transcript_8952/m.22619 type:complete len:109 (+) Transcript_8952:3094-3420(+)